MGGSLAVVVLAGLLAGSASAASVEQPRRFVVHPEQYVGPLFVGYGAQFNQDLYAKENVQLLGARIPRIERQLRELKAQYVRIFFDQYVLPVGKRPADCDRLRSFVKTVALAERSGATTINITYWKGEYPDPQQQMEDFADVISDLVHGTTRSPISRTCGMRPLAYRAVRQVTIQNEPNGSSKRSVNIDGPNPLLYAQLYQYMRTALDERRLRKVELVGGDLVGTRQAEWFQYMAQRMAGVLGGYSVHTYWDYWDPGAPLRRETEREKILAAFKGDARKPVYITEFGVRGANHEGGPGTWSNGQPVALSTGPALQQAAFVVLSANMGYAGLSRWDAYDAEYDVGAQNLGWGLIQDRPGSGLTPAYEMSRLLTHTIPAGSRACRIEAPAGQVMLAAFRKPGKGFTVIAVNLSADPQRIELKGLVPSTRFYRVDWNAKGDGRLGLERREPPVGLGLEIAPLSVTALATYNPGLPRARRRR